MCVEEYFVFLIAQKVNRVIFQFDNWTAAHFKSTGFTNLKILISKSVS